MSKMRKLGVLSIFHTVSPQGIYIHPKVTKVLMPFYIKKKKNYDRLPPIHQHPENTSIPESLVVPVPLFSSTPLQPAQFCSVTIY